MPSITFRAERSLAQELRRRAAREHRSLSSLVRHLLLTALGEPER